MGFRSANTDLPTIAPQSPATIPESLSGHEDRIWDDLDGREPLAESVQPNGSVIRLYNPFGARTTSNGVPLVVRTLQAAGAEEENLDGYGLPAITPVLQTLWPVTNQMRNSELAPLVSYNAESILGCLDSYREELLVSGDDSMFGGDVVLRRAELLIPDDPKNIRREMFEGDVELPDTPEEAHLPTDANLDIFLDELVVALRDVVQGVQHHHKVPDDFVGYRFHFQIEDWRERAGALELETTLSEQQAIIWALIECGFSQNTIATITDKDESTVSKYKSAAMDKIARAHRTFQYTRSPPSQYANVLSDPVLFSELLDEAERNLTEDIEETLRD